MMSVFFIIDHSYGTFLYSELSLSLSLSLGAVSNSDVGGHGSPLLPVSCYFDDLDFTDF